jgi:hypothetical protein
MTSALKAGDNIGIMDLAFFVSKNEILGWINSFFQVGKAPTRTLIDNCYS